MGLLVINRAAHPDTVETVMLDYEITPREARDLLENAANLSPDERPLLLDVREPAEFAAASVPNAIFMPMGQVSGRAHQELDPEQPVLVLCHHGVRSMNVAVWLRGQGFEKAQSIAGGIDRWASEIDKTIPRY
jgi:rhodanese-related sulfurtransferase